MIGVCHYSWVLLECFCSHSVVVCKQLICSELWLTIFCAHALFACAYDMDHVSAIIIIIIKVLLHRPKNICLNDICYVMMHVMYNIAFTATDVILKS